MIQPGMLLNLLHVSLLMDKGFKDQECCFFHPLSNDTSILLPIFQRREQITWGDDREGIVKTKAMKVDDVGLFFLVTRLGFFGRGDLVGDGAGGDGRGFRCCWWRLQLVLRPRRLVFFFLDKGVGWGFDSCGKLTAGDKDGVGRGRLIGDGGDSRRFSGVFSVVLAAMATGLG
ncbi:hypothetical protein Acr_00g0046460 [Actinidia rufa]|uniref:Uncharacterized protein n=1 Tax=Actinidia rufa TaxID=165716 RepID=A0A7J0DJJ4_9ERIC|nr:hypothetical protein Acr_00g0046460 [Actinidia rufa]